MKYRWHVYLADLEPVIGSEVGKTRPVLVISEEEVNEVIATVNIIPITSRKPSRTVYPNEVLLQKGVAGLLSESLALVHQVRTLDKRRLTKHIGSITDIALQQEIIEALVFQFGIR